MARQEEAEHCCEQAEDHAEHQSEDNGAGSPDGGRTGYACGDCREDAEQQELRGRAPRLNSFPPLTRRCQPTALQSSEAILDHWASPACLDAAGVGDDTSSHEKDPDQEPGERVEVLVALDPGWRDMPARRTRPVALSPRDEEEKHARSGE
jgi:hypothetical protein